MSTFEHKIDTVPAVVAMASLVEINTSKYPTGWGNYFWLANGLRVANFWAENLKEAARRFLTDGMVRVQVWSWATEGGRTASIALIDDPRIPEDWYYSELCWTGYGLPPVEVAREMFAVRGDPTNELEQLTDPASYHAKRGGKWHPNGYVSYALTKNKENPP